MYCALVQRTRNILIIMALLNSAVPSDLNRPIAILTKGTIKIIFNETAKVYEFAYMNCSTSLILSMGLDKKV